MDQQLQETELRERRKQLWAEYALYPPGPEWDAQCAAWEKLYRDEHKAWVERVQQEIAADEAIGRKFWIRDPSGDAIRHRADGSLALYSRQHGWEHLAPFSTRLAAQLYIACKSGIFVSTVRKVLAGTHWASV